MEERAFSPEHEEEVIELLDIVQPAAEGEERGEDIIELAAEDIESFGDAVPHASDSSEEEPLELVDVVAEGEAVEQRGDEPSVPAAEEEQELKLDVRGFEGWDFMEHTEMYADNPDAQTTWDHPDRILPVKNSDTRPEKGILTARLKKESWNVLRFKK